MSDQASAANITFAKIYAETGDAIEAYKIAYSENAKKVKYLKSTAYHKLSNPKIQELISEIQQGLRAQFVMLAPDALQRIEELAENAENERVKLDANKEILYGAGLKPPEQIEMKQVGIFGAATPEQLRDIIKAHIEEPDVVEAEVVDVT
jgi:phage terminase small subunit